jgi:DNA-binding NarL/FixJ family response regulator
MSHAVRPIRVLAADDGTLAHMRAALAGCADLDLTTSDALPDVAVIAPGHDGPGAIRAILHRSPATNVVVLATDVDRDHILAAVDAGARGYLLADDDPSGLPDAIRAAARGESPLAPQATRALISGHRLPRRDARLPAAEKQVLGLLARGCTDEVIAERLELEPAALDRALAVVIGALGVADRTQAALWAQRHGYDGGDGDPGQVLGSFTRDPGRIRRPERPLGQRPAGRTHDAEGCEDRVRSRRDGADPHDRRVR